MDNIIQQSQNMAEKININSYNNEISYSVLLNYYNYNKELICQKLLNQININTI